MMRVSGDDDVVIRGGILADPEALLEALEDSSDLGEGPVLSVWVGTPAEHKSLAACVRDVCLGADVRHGKVRLTTSKRLRDAGFELEHDTSDGQAESHFHVLFPDDPTMVEVNRFIDCFDDPIPNPAKENAQ
ncbi:hypothetical protein [Microbacterium sp. H83]|uniref:hypothetical protein n=1 Tax=Microbacterium sp. H83 TaxID=1827324 RepID=UPI0012F78C1B|nr:hypothetical protein [Microbacterium sp. H83]